MLTAVGGRSGWMPLLRPRMTNLLRPLRRIRRLALATTVVLLGTYLLASGSETTAGAQTADAAARRAEIRAEQARVAAQVDALRGDQREVIAALAAMDANVRGLEATVGEAKRRAEQSRADSERAEAEAAATRTEIDDLTEQAVRYAVAAYVDPPGDDLLRRFEAGSAQEDATRRALLDLRSGNDADALEQLRAAKQRLDDEIDRADRARRDAEAQVAEAETALERLSSARATQMAFAERVRQRLDERLSDAAYLSRMDAAIGASNSADADLANAVDNVPGTNPVPNVPGRPSLTTVGGITVATSIANDVRNLLAAASSAGIRLGGYGYRDINVQIQLRRQNCGTSDFAIWQMAADSCRPPTARPGYSAHEKGLAIDFHVNGTFIHSHSEAAWQWLNANASRYGFTNLPSEPWHWSHP